MKSPTVEAVQKELEKLGICKSVAHQAAIEIAANRGSYAIFSGCLGKKRWRSAPVVNALGHTVVCLSQLLTGLECELRKMKRAIEEGKTVEGLRLTVKDVQMEAAWMKLNQSKLESAIGQIAVRVRQLEERVDSLASKDSVEALSRLVELQAVALQHLQNKVYALGEEYEVNTQSERLQDIALTPDPPDPG